MNEPSLPFFGPGSDPGPSFADLLRRLAPHALPGAGLDDHSAGALEITHATTVSGSSICVEREEQSVASAHPTAAPAPPSRAIIRRS